MRGKSNFNIEPTVANFPFWMMIVFLSELANLLNESLALFKRIELESFGDGIVAWVIPTFNTASIDNVLDSSLIHFFEFVNAPLIESFEFRVEIVEVFEDSNAEKAGIKVGDAVRACNATPRARVVDATAFIEADTSLTKALFIADGMPFDNLIGAIKTN